MGKVQLAPDTRKWIGSINKDQKQQLERFGREENKRLESDYLKIAQHNTEEDAWIDFEESVQFNAHIHFHGRGEDFIASVWDRLHQRCSISFTNRQRRVYDAGMSSRRDARFVHQDEDEEDEEDFRGD